jgi:hypothetical protein
VEKVLERQVGCIKIKITEFTAPKIMSVYAKTCTVGGSLYIYNF